MTRKDQLKRKLQDEYHRLHLQGYGQYEAFDKLLDMQIQVKEVMSFDTLRNNVLRKKEFKVKA